MDLCDCLGLKKDAISYSTEMAHGTRLRRWQWTYSLLAEAVTASGAEIFPGFFPQQKKGVGNWKNGKGFGAEVILIGEISSGFIF